MQKKASGLGVKTRKVQRMMPIPLETSDAAAKEQFEVIVEQSSLLRPIEAQIDILKAKAKPIQKKIDEAMGKIQGGKQQMTDCTVTIDHTNCWIKVVREDTKEVVIDRPAEESELDPDAFDK